MPSMTRRRSMRESWSRAIRRRSGPEVQRGFLQILGGQTVPADHKGSGRELLAQWITDPKNPLTARVMVNRVWLWHFGRGLVNTPNDFGKRGEAPTHPELLDYLTSRFIEERLESEGAPQGHRVDTSVRDRVGSRRSECGEGREERVLLAL